METSVKWNLDEATEISVLSGLDVIRFVKSSRGGSYRYGVEKEIDGKIAITGARRVTTEALPALLEKYEAAGCGVLVATERKRTVLEPLKLGTKMVEVSTKKFDWKDVGVVLVKRYGADYFNVKFETDRINSKGRPVFNRYGKEYGHTDWLKRPFEWYASEVEEWMLNGSEFIILNTEGETMDYEQN